jgi:hypothetical protein
VGFSQEVKCYWASSPVTISSASEERGSAFLNFIDNGDKFRYFCNGVDEYPSSWGNFNNQIKSFLFNTYLNINGEKARCFSAKGEGP